MKNPRYVAFDTLGKLLVDAYDTVLLFKSREDALSVGAVKVKRTMNAKMSKKKMLKP